MTKEDRKWINYYYDKYKEHSEMYGEKTVVLLQIGSFFECYGEQDSDGRIHNSNLDEFARDADLNIAVKDGNDDKFPRTVMAGFKASEVILEKYTARLDQKGWSIVVYTQKAAGKGFTRSLSCINTPGTNFINENNTTNRNIITCWLNYSKRLNIVNVGIANCNIYTGKSTVYEFEEEFVDRSHTTFNELERYISIYKPSEIIFISDFSVEKMRDITEYCNINTATCKVHIISFEDSQQNTKLIDKAKNCEKQTYQNEIFKKFFNPADMTLFMSSFSNYVFAMQAYCYLLDFINICNPQLIHKITEPSIDNLHHSLVLENYSLRQLNILDDHNSHGKFSSIVKFLNVCATPMGFRRFENQLVKPTTDETFLNKEYNTTSFILENYDNFEYIRKECSTFKDLEKHVRKMILRKITPAAMVAIYNNFKTIRDIFENIKSSDRSDLHVYLLDAVKNDDIMDNCSVIIELIEKTMDIDIAKRINNMNTDENFLRKGINPELDIAVETYIQSQDELECIRSYLNNLTNKGEGGKKENPKLVKIHETEKMGLSLMATKKRCVALKTAIDKEDNINAITYDSSYDGSTKSIQFDNSSIIMQTTSSKTENSITNNQIRTLCDNITKYSIKLKDLISFTYIKFVISLENYMRQFHSIIDYVSALDVICTKAYIAKKYNYHRPNIENTQESSYFIAENLRHPLIEQINTNELYVTNNISLGVEGAKTNGILLYGTNAVGKTSIIRAIGISVIMAQAGLFVPCSRFTYKPYEYIFTRILNQDNLFKGQSTFTLEITELRRIIKYANNKSLILGDELCSGTELASAISIVLSGLKRFHNANSSFILATHLHQIIDMDEIKDLKNLRMNHMTVSYDEQTNKLIYDRKLKEGSGDDMYGLEVCKSLQLPEDFMRDCFEIRHKYNDVSILELKTSNYNSKKIKNTLCEVCKKNTGEDIHHINYQCNSDSNGFFDSFHKNHLGNLISICKECHDNIHKNNLEFVIKKTTDGYELLPK